jgi:transposase-like protein
MRSDELKRKTRRTYSSEEKIRIVIEVMRGEMTIAELCLKEGLSQGPYYKWSIMKNTASKALITQWATTYT